MPKGRNSAIFGLAVVCLATLLTTIWSGCGKNDSVAKSVVANTNEQVELVELNELLRKYVLTKKQVPKDVGELVTSGFITKLPSPPPGKRFQIDQNPFGYQVVLVDAQETR